MTPKNGKILQFVGQDEKTIPVSEKVLVLPTNPFAKAGLALIPFTPVPLSGPEAIYGWGRLALYGTLTYMTYSKSKKLSYVFGAATALSLVTSIAGKAWTDAKAKESV